MVFVLPAVSFWRSEWEEVNEERRGVSVNVATGFFSSFQVSSLLSRPEKKRDVM